LTFAGLTVREHLLAQKSDTAHHLDLRNTFLWWTGFTVAFSMADAYVAANMFGFKEEQRLEARISPLQFELTAGSRTAGNCRRSAAHTKEESQ